MADGATSSVGSVGSTGSNISLVGGSEGFLNPLSSVPTVVPDMIKNALEKAEKLKSSPIEMPQYSLDLQRNPYDPFSNPRFDRRQRAGFDYNENQMMGRHETKEQVYGNAVSFYSKMMGLGYNSPKMASYPRTNLVGCSSCSVDYTGQ